MWLRANTRVILRLYYDVILLRLTGKIYTAEDDLPRCFPTIGFRTKQRYRGDSTVYYNSPRQRKTIINTTRDETREIKGKRTEPTQNVQRVVRSRWSPEVEMAVDCTDCRLMTKLKIRTRNNKGQNYAQTSERRAQTTRSVGLISVASGQGAPLPVALLRLLSTGVVRTIDIFITIRNMYRRSSRIVVNNYYTHTSIRIYIDVERRRGDAHNENVRAKRERVCCVQTSMFIV